MAGSSTRNSVSGVRNGVRVVIAGDHGTGKSSLVASVASEAFPEKVPPVLPPTRLPMDFFPDLVPITIIDTSSSPESKFKRNEELKRADAVVLTYACDQPATLTRLRNYWLPELRQLEIKVPVIVVGCKLDLQDPYELIDIQETMSPIMKQYRMIEICIECSSATLTQVPDVFYFAQKAVLHPTAPLFDQQQRTLQPRCVRALRRIFILCDHDMDGALSDAELNEFQVKCFNAPIQPDEIFGVKRVVQENLSAGVNHLGLTFTGFLYLHALFIERGRLETTWAVLRKFGYDHDLKLRDDFLPIPCKRAPDQSVELSSDAMEFVRRSFRLFDTENDGSLRPTGLEELYSTAPESPWDEAPYEGLAEKTTQGNLSFNGFLSKWALMTLLDPQKSLAYLIYIGYSGDPSSALRMTRRRAIDRKKQKTERNVFQCFVFGPKNAGKSALLNSLIARPFKKSTNSSRTSERYAANVVEQLGMSPISTKSSFGIKKILILREIPEDRVGKFLSGKQFLAACDVAVFLYDGSDENSWKKSKDLLEEVARRGEESGYSVPSLIIATKDDLDPHPIAVQDSIRVCQKLGIEAPISVSALLNDMNNVFNRIVSAAERPNVSVPETETAKRRKYHQQLINRSLLCVSFGAAAAAGVAAYRVYAARRNTSG